MFRRDVLKSLLAALTLLFFQGGAFALTTEEAGRVVGTMEALLNDLGDLSYDEEAADIWFEEDEAYQGRIAAAGFSRTGWRDAVDGTMNGFYASLDRGEVEAMFAAMLSFEGRADFSDVQKAALRQMVRDTREKMARWRAAGSADATVVAPYASRIKAVLDGRDDG